MKRILIVAAALLTATPLLAQKANVRKAKLQIEMANANYALGNLDAEKLQKIRDLILPALTNPESAAMPDAWKIAAQLKLNEMNAMLTARAANNNQFVDAEAFFQNQYDLVETFQKFDELMHQPDAKGKLPYKEEEMAKEHTLAQQMAKGPRSNLFIAATNLVNSKPEECIHFLNLYYKTFDYSIFSGLDLRAQDEHLTDSYYVYATALRATGADRKLIEENLTRGLESATFGKNACFDLMEAYKADKDMENWKKYCAIAIEKYPEEGVFGRLLMQEYVNDKQWDKVLELAATLIERNKANSVTDEWPYYFRAVALFSTDKFEEAYTAFTETISVKDDFIEAVAGAGRTAWKIGQDNAAKTAVSKEWYNKAIQHFERAKEIAPDQPEHWGYSLYACYNNIGNTAKAAPYKKYNKD